MSLFLFLNVPLDELLAQYPPPDTELMGVVLFLPVVLSSFVSAFLD